MRKSDLKSKNPSHSHNKCFASAPCRLQWPRFVSFSLFETLGINASIRLVTSSSVWAGKSLELSVNSCWILRNHMPEPNRSLSVEHTLEMKRTKCQNPKSMEQKCYSQVQWSVFCSHVPSQKCEQFWPTTVPVQNRKWKINYPPIAPLMICSK